ncbi:WD40-repeat-containing domain protein [Zopfochytrium polystomum]|nr:WD40-repeat-containing domain protein [Zopfochytrium polystomum]
MRALQERWERGSPVIETLPASFGRPVAIHQRFIVCALSRGKINVLRKSDWHCVRTLAGHKGEVLDACVNASGCKLLTCSKDGTVRLWDMTKGSHTIVLNNFKLHINRVRFTANAILAAGNTGEAVLFDSTSAARLQVCQSLPLGRAWDANDNCLASMTDGPLVELWDPATCLLKQALLQGNSPMDVGFVHFDRDRIAVTGFCSPDIAIWDLKTYQVWRTINTGVSNALKKVALAGCWLACHAHGVLMVWDVESGTQLQEFRESSSVQSILMDSFGVLIVYHCQTEWRR